MAKRQNTFLLKRSNVPGKVPSPGDIQLGELALNTADVILYASGTTANKILPIGWDRIHRTGDTVTGDFNFFGDISISGSTQPNGYALSITGDTNIINDLYVGGNSTYGGNLFVSGSTIIQNGLTANTIYTDYIDFNLIANPPHKEGRIHWNDNLKTLQVDTENPDVQINAGHDIVQRVVNNTGVPIVKGKVVYINGQQGGRPTITLASNVNDLTSARTFGVVMDDIPNGQNGYVIVIGLLEGINTNSYTSGQVLYLSTNGDMTPTKPIAPDHLVYVAKVIRVGNSSTGSIFVAVQNGYELDEIHDVRITNPLTGDLLIRKSYLGTPVWVNSKSLVGNYTISGNTSFYGNICMSNVNSGGLPTGTNCLDTTLIPTGTTVIHQFQGESGVLAHIGDLASGEPNSRGYTYYENNITNTSFVAVGTGVFTPIIGAPTTFQPYNNLFTVTTGATTATIHKLTYTYPPATGATSATFLKFTVSLTVQNAQNQALTFQVRRKRGVNFTFLPIGMSITPQANNIQGITFNGISDAWNNDEFQVVVKNDTGSGGANSIRVVDLSFSMFT